MACLPRSVLIRWIIALVALGLVSAPLHAGAMLQAHGISTSRFASPQSPGEAAIVGSEHAGHQHAPPIKHASGKFCCQAACVMALPLIPCNTGPHVVPSVKMPMQPDPIPPAPSPFGIDRPPKPS